MDKTTNNQVEHADMQHKAYNNNLIYDSEKGKQILYYLRQLSLKQTTCKEFQVREF